MPRANLSTAENNLLLNNIQGMTSCHVAIHRPAVLVDYKAIAGSSDGGAGVGIYAISGTFTGATNAVRNNTILYHDHNLYSRLRVTPSGTGSMDVQQLGTGEGSTGFVSVYKEFRPHVYRQRFSSPDWYMDYDIGYTDAQNENFIPQAQFGTTQVFYQDGAVTFAFDGTRSRAWTPLATITDYLWTFPDGSTAATSTATWTTSTAYPNGAYVSLMVTDSNTRTHTTHRLIYKFDTANPPSMEVVAGDISGSFGNGCELSARVKTWKKARAGDLSSTWDSPAGIENIPDGTHITVFAKFQYGTTASSFIGDNSPTPGTGAWRVLFDGWTVGGVGRVTSETNEYSLRAQTIDGVLSKLLAPAVMFDTDAAPASWLEMKLIQLDNCMWHMVNYRSNVSEIVDVDCGIFQGAGYFNAQKKYFDLANATLWAQFRELAGMIPGGVVSCDSQSSIYMEIDEGVKTGVPTLAHNETGAAYILQSMLFNIETTYDHTRELAQITLGGIDYETPIIVPSPADPFGQGATLDEKLSGYALDSGTASTFVDNIRAMRNFIGSLGVSGIKTEGKNFLINCVPQGTHFTMKRVENNFLMRAPLQDMLNGNDFFRIAMYPRAFIWSLEPGYVRCSYNWQVVGIDEDYQTGG